MSDIEVLTAPEEGVTHMVIALYQENNPMVFFLKLDEETSSMHGTKLNNLITKLIADKYRNHPNPKIRIFGGVRIEMGITAHDHIDVYRICGIKHPIMYMHVKNNEYGFRKVWINKTVGSTMRMTGQQERYLLSILPAVFDKMAKIEGIYHDTAEL